MDTGVHPALGELLPQPIALFGFNHVQVEHVLDAGPRGGRMHAAQKTRAIGLGVGAPRRVPAIEVRKFHREHGRLHRVEARIAPFDRVLVLHALPVIPEEPQLFRRATVVGHDDPGVAVRAEVLRWVEAEGRRVAERAGAPPADARAVRLRGVFDDDEIVPRRDRQHRLDVGRLSVQVDRHDGARARRDGGADRGRIDRVRLAVHVDEHGPGAGCRDRQHGRDERVRRGDDLVAGPDVERPQRQLDRIAAVADADCVADADVRREVALEPRDRAAVNEVAAIDHLPHRAIDVGADLLVLRAKIDERHLRRGGHVFSPRPR